MKGYEIKFSIYAESEEEAEKARNAIVGFINEHAAQGRAVTGGKIAEALSRWKSNPFVRNKIVEFFRS